MNIPTDTPRIAELALDDRFAPYQKAAAEFRREHTAELARLVGGGRCGPGAASMVASAALQLGASRFYFDLAAETGEAELFDRASNFANDSSRSLLAAHELCAREAKARPKKSADATS